MAAGRGRGETGGFSQAKMVIRAGETSETHTHGNCHEFFLVEEGDVTLVQEGTPHTLKQGDHRLIAPGVAHHVVAGDQGATLTLTYSAAVREYTAVS